MSASNQPAPGAATAASTRYPFGKVAIALLIVWAISSVLNYVVLWLAAGPLGIESNFGPFASAPGVAIFNLMFLAVAALVFWFLANRGPGGLKTWNTVALVGLILSLVPNALALFGLFPEEMMGVATVPAILVLVAMHFVSYFVAIWGFPRFGKG
jgi:hypothetical protein